MSERKLSRNGIYTASKTRHASLWRALRDQGYPIISTWIDEAGEGESRSLSDLWVRCIRESSRCAVLLLYVEPGDVLKGAHAEAGVALSHGIPVHYVGPPDLFSMLNHPGVRQFDTTAAALAAACIIIETTSVGTQTLADKIGAGLTGSGHSINTGTLFLILSILNQHAGQTLEGSVP